MKAAIFLFSLGVAMALAQTPAPEQDPQLARIRAKMADNLRRLPNYTCLMTVERFARPASRVFRDLNHIDTVRLEVAEVGDNELLGWPGSTLSDRPLSDFVASGLMAKGDFAGLANIVFRSTAPTFQAAGKKKINGRETIGYFYRVALPVSHYEVQGNGETAVVAYHGSFWVDPESLEVRRMELELDGIPDSFGIRFSSTTIDYQKARIGASDFLLPFRVKRTVGHAVLNAMSENVSTYTNCRQYEAQSAIRFDQPAGPDSAAPAAAPLNPTEIRLPGGVRLPMKVETAGDPKKPAIGDPLVARLTEEVRLANLVFPAGSEIHGRIRSLRYDPRGPCRVELEFTELRTPAALVRFQGFVESIEKHKGIALGNIFKADELEVDSRNLNLVGLVLNYRTLAAEK